MSERAFNILRFPCVELHHLRITSACPIVSLAYPLRLAVIDAPRLRNATLPTGTLILTHISHKRMAHARLIYFHYYLLHAS